MSRRNETNDEVQYIQTQVDEDDRERLNIGEEIELQATDQKGREVTVYVEPIFPNSPTPSGKKIQEAIREVLEEHPQVVARYYFNEDEELSVINFLVRRAMEKGKTDVNASSLRFAIESDLKEATEVEKEYNPKKAGRARMRKYTVRYEWKEEPKTFRSDSV